MNKVLFGHISGFSVNSTFKNREELSISRVHRPTMAGIGGSEKIGADSIVLSGGYEDDEDLGNLIIYTGQGGRDSSTGKQNAHQTLTRGNLALAKSKINGFPVRVIRGSNHKSNYSPQSGYRYDGLFRVEDYWREKGKSGFYVWRYRLVKISADETSTDEQVKVGFPDEENPEVAPRRVKTSVLRIVRDTKQARDIKEIYEYHCQVCNIVLLGSAGHYAEAAHIKPLGAPHFGPDIQGNILCLCPNHHVLFDMGGFSISDDFTLIGLDGRLTVNKDHKIVPEYIQYHREAYPVK